ncbi:MAG TPA: hypothetical protein VGL66_15945 [Caulobacteraceae bacterium]|jgi:hypothetical protein
MIRWLCAVLALSIATPTMAAQTVHRQIGQWLVMGTDGTCSASTKLGDGTMLLIFAPPPTKENAGGMMIASPKGAEVAAGRAVVQLSGRGSVTGDHNAIGYAELKAYWLPFADTGEIDRYPDSWQLTATKDGAVLADQPVSDFKVMVAALKVCATA